MGLSGSCTFSTTGLEDIYGIPVYPDLATLVFDSLDSLDDMVGALLERLEGLDDAEYLWEPVVGMWSVRSGADGVVVDFDLDRDIEPAPVTTIAWRLWHISSDCFDSYRARLEAQPDEIHLGWTLSATEAIERVTTSWRALRAVLAATDDWYAELGESFGPWHRHCVADLAMHASNELVHHGAEVALLRDLFAARPQGDALS